MVESYVIKHCTKHMEIIQDLLLSLHAVNHGQLTTNRFAMRPGFVALLSQWPSITIHKQGVKSATQSKIPASWILTGGLSSGCEVMDN